MRSSFFLSTTISLLLALSMPVLSVANQVDNSITSFYLIRHAEKDLSDTQDPALTAQGLDRAQNWASALSHIPLTVVYSTDTRRTRDTATPIADSQNLDIVLYNPHEIDFEKFAQKNSGQSVVVVGHSNTTPEFANGLLKSEQYQDLDESVYGALFIVEQVNGVWSSKVLMINP